MPDAHALIGGFTAPEDRGVLARPDAVQLPEGFRDASRRLLHVLQAIAPMGVWMLTRTVGEDMVVLEAESPAYDLAPGDVAVWQDVLCRAMTAGEGPRVAGDVENVPAYAASRIRDTMAVRSYAGVEVVTGDGELFGTLCGLDPAPQHHDAVVLEGLLTSSSALLSRVLTTELALLEAQRGFARVAGEAETDHLTGLRNRRGWDAATDRLEKVASSLGTAVAVVVADLDGLKAVNDRGGHGAGDAVLRGAAEALLAATRTGDVAARLGGDEFALLLPGAGPEQAERVVARLRAALVERGVAASVGWAPRGPDGLTAAWHRADALMYAEKGARGSAA